MVLIGNLSRAVFHTVAYADVFDYPLTAREGHRYLTGAQASLEEVERALADATLFAHAGEFYALCGRAEIFQTRNQREKIASRLWRKSGRYGRIIASLPFVRMAAVSGSLAVDNTEEGKDIDYLLVTAPKRLWTVRAMTLALARIARLEGLSLCPNYLLTTNALELSDRSLYAAHELAQMIPLSGMEVYAQMRRLNAWTDDSLPNAQGAPSNSRLVKIPTRWQRFLESILDLLRVDIFEKWEMDRKIQKLTREQSSSPEASFSADVCKGHKDSYGQRTNVALEERLESFGFLDDGEKNLNTKYTTLALAGSAREDTKDGKEI
jgi:hypothetical protein